jgi:hypothetical protein
MMAMLASESPRQAYERVKASEGDVLLESVGYVFLHAPKTPVRVVFFHCHRWGAHIFVTPEAHGAYASARRRSATQKTT